MLLCFADTGFAKPVTDSLHSSSYVTVRLYCEQNGSKNSRGCRNTLVTTNNHHTPRPLTRTCSSLAGSKVHQNGSLALAGTSWYRRRTPPVYGLLGSMRDMIGGPTPRTCGRGNAPRQLGTRHNRIVVHECSPATKTPHLAVRSAAHRVALLVSACWRVLTLRGCAPELRRDPVHERAGPAG